MLPWERMRRALFLLVLPLAPALVLAATAATADPPHQQVPIVRDPPPLTEREQWVFDLRWDRGDVYLLGARKITMPTPMTTPRVMGRFAIELWERGKLVERTRFDFPGMAVPDEEGGIQILPKLRTRIGVFFPATSRGDKLVLVDRLTAQQWALPWPPVPASTGGISDGGLG